MWIRYTYLPAEVLLFHLEYLTAGILRDEAGSMNFLMNGHISTIVRRS